MQTITQSVVESYTKLVYKYIKQDVEAENNHTAKGRVEQMGTPTEIYKNPKTPFCGAVYRRISSYYGL